MVSHPVFRVDAALECLIPRRIIADRCRFDSRLLVMRGDLRTY
jgi:hypothetical protein